MAVRQVNMVPTLLFIKPLVFPKKCNEHLNVATLWKKNKMKIKLRFDSCQTNFMSLNRHPPHTEVFRCFVRY